MTAVWCRCVRLRCPDCGWVGDQSAAIMHAQFTCHAPGIVDQPACGQEPCRTRAMDDLVRVSEELGLYERQPVVEQ